MFNVHFGEVDVFRGAQFAQPHMPELLANGSPVARQKSTSFRQSASSNFMALGRSRYSPKRSAPSTARNRGFAITSEISKMATLSTATTIGLPLFPCEFS